MMTEGEQIRGRDESHPNYIAEDSAMDKCCQLYSCANGNSASIISEKTYTPYITRGLILIQSTRKMVTKPDNIKCSLCANRSKGHKEQAFKSKFGDYKNVVHNNNAKAHELSFELDSLSKATIRCDNVLNKMRKSPFYSQQLDK
jgi:hypothetical protein